MIDGREREILKHDFGNVEYVLDDVLEGLKVLESAKDATSKRKMVEVKMRLELDRMECRIVKKKLFESYG